MANFVVVVPDKTMANGIRIAVGPFDPHADATNYVARSGTDKTCAEVRLSGPIDPADDDADLDA